MGKNFGKVLIINILLLLRFLECFLLNKVHKDFIVMLML